jgi:hypothetical protein
MQDRPDAPELANAIAGFLRDELLPQLADARLQFRLRVAINGVTMLEREAREGRSAMAAGNAAIEKALGLPHDSRDPALAAPRLHAELARRIREDQPPPGLLPLLRVLTELKLRVASPATLTRYGRNGQEGSAP